MLANNATGIEETTADKDGSKEVSNVKYYNVNGVEVTTPSKGLYIEKVTYTDGRSEAKTVLF